MKTLANHPSRRHCLTCGRTKHKRNFKSRDLCLVCAGEPRAVVPRSHRNVLTQVAPPSMSAEALARVVAPSPEELEAVEECVRLMLADLGQPHGSNQSRPGPEVVIDAVVSDPLRRIRLGSLAIQMATEAARQTVRSGAA